MTAWFAAAAHEVPQEIADFGVLVHGGFGRTRALLFNFLSALTFPAGMLLAYAAAGTVETAMLVPFGAGNFLYIAAADLIPEVKHAGGLRSAFIHLLSFVAGLALLFAVDFAS